MGNSCTKSANPPKFQACQYNRSHFEFKKVIGKGGFGRVWKVIDKKSKKVYAMKVMDKAKIITKRSVGSVINERDILCRIQNGFIVNMHSAFQDRESLYLLIDYLEGGDLRYYINRAYAFSEDKIKFVIRCIMQGLKYLHENNIIHRDIKPQNIILDRHGYCRITDLGIAREWKSENSHENSGTAGYMAPEVLLRQNHSFCADYFAVGVIAYQLAIGSRPYQGRDRKSIRQQMLAKQSKIPTEYKGLSKQGIDFINKMLQRYCKKRLGYNGIDEVINHPWIKMSINESEEFQLQTSASPITPLHLNVHQSMQLITEQDEATRENKLLLKKPQTQLLFADYDYLPNRQKTVHKKDEQTSMKSTHSFSVAGSGIRQEVAESSTTSPFQDTISFMPPSSTRKKTLSTRT